MGGIQRTTDMSILAYGGWNPSKWRSNVKAASHSEPSNRLSRPKYLGIWI
jgi:hypothetical protein